MKHTQGEWEIQGTAVFSNGKLVANCVSDGIHFTNEDKANARLIANAPKLLEYIKVLNTLVAILTNKEEGSKAVEELINKIESHDIQH